MDVTEALKELSLARYPFPTFDVLLENLPSIRPRMESAAKTAKSYPLATVKLISPVANAGKVLAAPVNYRKHLEEAQIDEQIHHGKQVSEIQRVGLFLKATSSIVGPSQGITIRHPERRTDHEIELAVVIGKRGDRLTRANAMSHVAGYCIGLDITVRGPEERSMRKSIDSYTVLGPCLVTADEIADTANLDLRLAVNGDVRQKANTRDLVIDIADLLVFASSFYTLMPGDVLLTGTPEGVGPIVSGDIIDAEISGIGRMSVTVH